MNERRALFVILAEMESLLCDPEFRPAHPELREAVEVLEP